MNKCISYLPILFLFCLFISIISEETLYESSDYHWTDFKEKYNKSYPSKKHEMKARVAWEENIVEVNRHNSLKHSFKLHLNHLSDLTLRQYMKRMVKLLRVRENEHERVTPNELIKYINNVPSKFDWREKGFRPKIPDQGHCGSCYAFTSSFALEAQLFIKKKKLVALSAQQIIDCSRKMGNYGCGGGKLFGTLSYLKKYGAMSSHEYPYQNKATKCKWNLRKVIANATSWGVLPKNERILEAAVALYGPIAASIDATPNTFMLYNHGIYDDHKCSAEHVNHAVLLVGYTEKFWIIQNSWGPRWGDNGYIKLRKGVNRCGISNAAAYILME